MTQTSVLDADADAVWARVVTPEGIRDELRPWMTMRMPPSLEGLGIDQVPLGQDLGRAWLWLFGVLPFDYDRLRIAEVQPGRRFRETSTMGSMRAWEHERTVEPLAPGRSRITDRITFEPRLPLRVVTPAFARVVAALFRHRHRRLATHFAST